MKNEGISIETLKELTIGEIKQLEKSLKDMNDSVGDVIDQKKEFLRCLNDN